MGMVALKYKLEGTQYIGCVTFAESSREVSLVMFHTSSWPNVLTHFASMLSKYPEAIGCIERTDQTHLRPFMLLSADTELFRTDPELAIKQWSYEVEVPQSKPLPPVSIQPIPAGYSTLISSFGEYVAIRYRSSIDTKTTEVECVISGKWTKVLDDLSYLCSIDGTESKTSLSFSLINVPFAWVDKESGWAVLKTLDVLTLPANKFFLPRPWNVNGNWIKKEQLSKMYENYLKEIQ